MPLEVLILPVAVLGLMGLVFGLFLAFSGKAFEVKEDPRISQVKAKLPGVNCGACGFPGCDGLAAAIVNAGERVDACPVGGEDTAKAVAGVMGVELTATVNYVARVFCGGAKDISKPKYAYDGILDCVAAYSLHGGPLACATGCVGFGNCKRACPFGAIVIENGLARILEDKCKACEKCVAACPKKLIEMVPRDKHYGVICKSPDKGAVTRKNCAVGCIGCGKCVKACPVSAITLGTNLAKIDPLLCTNCNACREVCPTGSIRHSLQPFAGRKPASPGT